MSSTMLDSLAKENDVSTSERNANDEVLKAGRKFTFRSDGTSYTIVSASADEVQSIQNGITKIRITSVSRSYIMRLYCEYKIDMVDHDGIMTEKELSDDAIQLYRRYTEIMDEMKRKFRNDFVSLKTERGTAFVRNAAEKYNISAKTIWKKIRLYLQSGFDDHSLYDGRSVRTDFSREKYSRKTGRKNRYTKTGKLLTEDDRKIMDKYVKEYKSSTMSSVSQCYKDMIGAYYTKYIRNEDGSCTPVLFSPDEMPSVNQFRYYLNKVLTEKEKAMIRAARNDVSQGNASLNDADNFYDVYGPTTVAEMDEQELDFSAVSGYDPTMCIGRLILHLIIDVQTRLIMGVSVSLDNNSVIGACNALMNAAEPSKKEFAARFGIEISDSMWPSGYRIQSLRVDRGAEYMSKEFERICNENRITLIPTPARTASRKGTVEQQFHIFNSMWKDIMAEYGAIQKLHSSSHHAKATLDYFAVTKIIIGCCIRHNISEIADFKRSRKMIEERISTAPVSLWKYFDEKYHTLSPIGNTSAYLYSLMTPVKCHISRQGVRWEGLWYLYDDNAIDEIRWHGKNKTMEVRMDRRDVSMLYYIRDGKMHIMRLNPDKTYNMDFDGMPYEMYMEYREIQKELTAHAREQNIEADVINRSLVREVLKESQRDTYANITNMYLNRKAEKNLLRSENAISSHLDSSNDKLTAEEPAAIDKNAGSGEWPEWDSISDEMKDSERNLITD